MMAFSLGRFRRAFVAVAAAVAWAMGLLALAGWVFQLDGLKGLIPGAVQMKANTAVGLLLAGTALLMGLRRRSPSIRYGSHALAACVFLIGALTLSQYLLGWNLHIDELLFRDLASAYNAAPGRMSPFSAWTFVGLGTGLCFVRCRAAGWIAYVCGAQVAGIGIVSLLGYLWNAAELVTDVWLPPVALNTALAFAALGLGVVAAHFGASATTGVEAAVSPVEAKVVFAMLGTVIVLVASAGYTYRSIVRFTEQADRMAVEHTKRVELQSALRAAVVAQYPRGPEGPPLPAATLSVLAGETLRLVDEMDAADQHSLAEQAFGLQTARSTMLVWLIVTIGLSVGVFVVLTVSVRREMGHSALVRAELSELNNNLERRVRERTAELDEANSHLNAFMSSLAHDLRQPLISVGGFGDLLDKRLVDAGDAPSRKFLARISRAMRQVDACTNALLELGQVSRRTLWLQTVDIAEMAQYIGGVLQAQEPDRAVKLVIEPGVAAAKADKSLLTVALGHLINNAWKFTRGRDDAEIQIGSGEAEDGSQVWWVRDNGAGFEMAYADKLFKPFQRLHGQDEFPGLGTGLAIVHAVIARHKGQVWAESAPGKGAVFYFTLGLPPGDAPLT